ncbi:MAG: potassium-transporting ATPase subunit KdpA [Actinobacteria bacterium]|nr:potassium-transporting ATPase subunit KdpA [Actinomycetota bacterium]MBO0830416.1 potassium-transporting ATPase subunit KdpA [Actinomycetota bacterium]MBO0835007.1 potassium-transporting ATPase subunit KdpA [Actinomycetota bacterium]
MNSAFAGWLQLGLLAAALAACYVPVGNYMTHIFTTDKHWRVERSLYRLVGANPEHDQKWSSYLRSMLAFSLISVLFLYGIQRLQGYLLLSEGMKGVPPALAWNTAASFVTNTNWQNYSGESTMGYLTQMSGLAVQNFMSAAVGIAVAIALVRGFRRSRTDKLGNFWVDATRITIRYLVPLAVVGGVILMAGGVIDNLASYHTVTTLSGAHQTIVGGPVASQEVIKEAGNNGGGFFNANSSHPFESPTPFTNWFEIFLILLTAFCLPRTFGKMVKDNRQGYALLAAMVIIWLVAVGGISFFETHYAVGGATAAQLAHGAAEGTETRFGATGCSLFAASTTVTSTGAVNCFHDSLTPFGGGIALADMALGEVAPGGVGAGLYGILVLAIVTVFVGGLMVGRTPEYIGKKIRPAEMKYAALYFLTTPASVLAAAGLSVALPASRASILNPGPHGLTEILYAFTSMANNNGSAFAGLTTNTYWYNTVGGLVMLVARFAPMIFAVGLAGSLARQQPVPASVGTIQTHKPLFVGMLVGVILVLIGLTYFPALALGPFAEGLH